MVFRDWPRRTLSGAFFTFACVVGSVGSASSCGSEGARDERRNGTESAGATLTRAGSSRGTISTIPEAELRHIGGTIAFISERSGNKDIYLLDPGEGLERRLTASPGDEFPAAFAADGRSLLVIETEGDGIPGQRERLVLHDLTGDRRPAPLTAYSARVRNPGFGPGARWLVFESDAGSFRDIYRLDLPGRALSRLTDNREGNFEPDVSPDGRRIVFVSSRDGNAQIYSMNSDGSAERRLTAFHRDDWSPRWSPDGRRIAFMSDRDGRARVYVMNSDGTGLGRLTAGSPAAVELAAEAAFAWSPDGREIAFVGRTEGNSSIWVAALDRRDGRAPAIRDLSTGNADGALAWSPDGRYLAFSSMVGDGVDLHVVRADGSGVARLTHAQGADWLPRWIP